METTPEVIEAMRAVVETHTGAVPGRCEWCGQTNAHMKDSCPVADFEAFLAAHDAPKGETENRTFHIAIDDDQKMGVGIAREDAILDLGPCQDDVFRVFPVHVSLAGPLRTMAAIEGRVVE